MHSKIVRTVAATNILRQTIKTTVCYSVFGSFCFVLQPFFFRSELIYFDVAAVFVIFFFCFSFVCAQELFSFIFFLLFLFNLYEYFLCIFFFVLNRTLSWVILPLIFRRSFKFLYVVWKAAVFLPYATNVQSNIFQSMKYYL